MSGYQLAVMRDFFSTGSIETSCGGKRITNDALISKADLSDQVAVPEMNTIDG